MLDILGKFNEMFENLTIWEKLTYLDLGCDFKIIITLIGILVQREVRAIQQMPRCLTPCVLC